VKVEALRRLQRCNDPLLLMLMFHPSTSIGTEFRLLPHGRGGQRQYNASTAEVEILPVPNLLLGP